MLCNPVHTGNWVRGLVGFGLVENVGINMVIRGVMGVAVFLAIFLAIVDEIWRQLGYRFSNPASTSNKYITIHLLYHSHVKILQPTQLVDSRVSRY